MNLWESESEEETDSEFRSGDQPGDPNQQEDHSEQ
ncbi:uncharacterized protein FTOL_13533 [Fusarium torulosum]|uniref:Uncharacterized protein n=1 Tax=Fusarium torulosum TaxID=33205 RepID=A0AAE8SQC4_9HYPO|nr:uncharacterized protein FTOL_13533 [Fusarium torulosum]